MPPTANPQNSDSPQPAMNAVATSSIGTLLNAAQRFPLLDILIALLIPPLGLIVAVLIGLKSQRPRKVRLATAIVAASIIGTIGYLTFSTNLINISVRNGTTYNYQDTNSNKFSTIEAGGMTFSKPSKFTSTAKKSEQKYSMESFAHLGLYKYPLSYIFIFSYKDSHNADKEYVRGVNDFMAGTVKTSYRTEYIDAIKKQVFDSYPGYNATLSEPQKFTNANIKKDAWSFDLEVTNTNSQIRPMKGKLVYVLGPDVTYYFSLMVTEDNWTSNMATWQTVLGSLKLGA